jgi:predicted transcriptional regulator
VIDLGTITISVNDKVERKFREIAGSIYSKKKGYLGKAITEAMERWIDEKRQGKIAEQELKVLEKGFDMGKVLFKRREELYER